MHIKENIKNIVTEQVKEKGTVLADKAIEQVSAGCQQAGGKDKAISVAADIVGDIVDNIVEKVVN